MNSTPHLFPALISSGLCGEQGVFLPQSAQSFAQGAQRGYGGDWCSTTFKLPRRLTATLPLYSAIHEIPHCVRNDEGEFNHSSSRGAMSAGDADEVVRVFSLCSKQACRLDFLLLFSQAIRREDKGRKWGISMSLEFFVLFFQEKSTEEIINMNVYLSQISLSLPVEEAATLKAIVHPEETINKNVI